MSASFAIFWDQYDKKIGKDAALKAWKKLTENEKQSAQDLAATYALATPEKRYRPHPSTYLNQRRWTDDISDVAVTHSAGEISKMARVAQVFKKVMNEKLTNANGQPRINNGMPELPGLNND